MKIINTLIVLLMMLVTILAVRGKMGNPTEADINQLSWTDDGPLELSPERGKFALLFSMIEQRSFHFSLPIARFSTPDLASLNGQYMSLFPPGLSVVLIPGYVIGKYFGVSQVGTYLTIGVFALLNVWLIRGIAIHLGANPLVALTSGIVFSWGTPAFAYGVSLYQHHVSLFLLLLSLFALLRLPRMIGLFVVWLCVGLAIPIDNPNVFLLFPVGLYGVFSFFGYQLTSKKIIISFRWKYVFTFIAMLPPLLLFLWYNQVAYGNPFQLAGTLPAVKAIDEQGLPAAPSTERLENIAALENPELQEKSAVLFFNTRLLNNGLYIHILSVDRGMLVYAPIMLLGIAGIVFAFRKNPNMTALLLAVIGVNLLLYSMWGDPYGGWAFGSRYLIPTYALLAVFLAVWLSHYLKNIFVFLLFLVLSIYSISVNTIGALTSNRNPPKVEVLAIEQFSGREEKYTFERNMDMLSVNQSKSFIFQTVGHQYMSAWQYTLGLIFLISTLPVSLIAMASRRQRQPYYVTNYRQTSI